MKLTPQSQKQWMDRYDARLCAWATINNVTRGAEFTLDALSRSMRSGGSWGHPHSFPGSRHLAYFRRYGSAAAMVAEPYDERDVEALRAYAVERGLVVTSPAHKRASLYWPGECYFVVLTAPSFGQVHLLPEQLVDAVVQPAPSPKTARKLSAPLARQNIASRRRSRFRRSVWATLTELDGRAYYGAPALDTTSVGDVDELLATRPDLNWD